MPGPLNNHILGKSDTIESDAEADNQDLLESTAKIEEPSGNETKKLYSEDAIAEKAVLNGGPTATQDP